LVYKAVFTFLQNIKVGQLGRLNVGHPEPSQLCAVVSEDD
jgi:hypothetical protein